MDTNIRLSSAELQDCYNKYDINQNVISDELNNKLYFIVDYYNTMMNNYLTMREDESSIEKINTINYFYYNYMHVISISIRQIFNELKKRMPREIGTKSAVYEIINQTNDIIEHF